MRKFEVCKQYGEEEVILPKRGTKNAAGYDFYAAEEIEIPSIWKEIPKAISYIAFASERDEEGRRKKPFKSILTKLKEYVRPTIVKTGVKVYLNSDEVLTLANRSSGALKLYLLMANGIGVIDADYADNPDNDGDIGFMFWNLSPLNYVVKKGDKIGQGIVSKFLLMDDDEGVDEERVGGYGSTGVR